jgi:hypothetical protein
VVLPGTATLGVVAGDPDPDTLTYTWTVASGPGTVGFLPNGTALSDSSTATFGQSGTYVLRVTVSDGEGGSTNSDVSVTVNPGAGDLNGDGEVNIDDLFLVTSNFGKTTPDGGFDTRADENSDGMVNIDDLTVVTSNFGKAYR